MLRKRCMVKMSCSTLLERNHNTRKDLGSSEKMLSFQDLFSANGRAVGWIFIITPWSIFHTNAAIFFRYTRTGKVLPSFQRKFHFHYFFFCGNHLALSSQSLPSSSSSHFNHYPTLTRGVKISWSLNFPPIESVKRKSFVDEADRGKMKKPSCVYCNETSIVQ